MTTRTLALNRLPDLHALPALPIGGLCLDHRNLRPGDAFVALPGARVHGIRFAAEAIQAGAAVVLYEPPLPADMAAPAQAIAVPGLRARLGAMADFFYDSPSAALRVIGVTGTNGKTSTVQLLAQALHQTEAGAGSIGTLGAGIHGALQAGERTTPDVISVHRLLAQLRALGAMHVAMEVSSHALDQGRVDAVRFSVAVFTNLTRDHLDYHGSMETYAATKAKLFAWPGLAASVFNLDDPFGLELAQRVDTTPRRIGYSAAGRADAEIAAHSSQFGNAGIDFDLRIGSDMFPVHSALIGRFNLENLLAVAAVLHALHWPADRIAARLSGLQAVPGRMQRLGGDANAPLVVVDYAHTPDALAQALACVRAHVRGRVICVFGCGGDRDRGKRPQMAALAEAGADRVIVTDDNPRHESGDAIVSEIVAGFRHPEAVVIERDRARAIALAIATADVDDAVLIAGKGHESYQEIGETRVAFDDVAQARAALEARA